MVRRDEADMRRRCGLCIERGGGHVEGVELVYIRTDFHPYMNWCMISVIVERIGLSSTDKNLVSQVMFGCAPNIFDSKVLP
jgi:hypothetical protein